MELVNGNLQTNRIMKIINNNWALYVFMAVISIYYSGVASISNNIAFILTIKLKIDPSLLKNDLIFSNIDQVGKFLFTGFTVFLTRFFNVEKIAFFYFLISRVLLSGGIYKLSYALSRNKKVALLSVFAIFWLDSMQIPIGVTVFTNITFYPKFMAVPVLLFGISYLVEGKHKVSFFLLGLATSFHFVVSTQVFIILLLYCLIHFKQIGWKEILILKSRTFTARLCVRS